MKYIHIYELHLHLGDILHLRTVRGTATQPWCNHTDAKHVQYVLCTCEVRLFVLSRYNYTSAQTRYIKIYEVLYINTYEVHIYTFSKMCKYTFLERLTNTIREG
jgi:hypothetical protein